MENTSEFMDLVAQEALRRANFVISRLDACGKLYDEDEIVDTMTNYITFEKLLSEANTESKDQDSI